MKTVGLAVPGAGWLVGAAVGGEILFTIQFSDCQPKDKISMSFVTTYGVGRYILNLHVDITLALLELKAEKTSKNISKKQMRALV